MAFKWQGQLLSVAKCCVLWPYVRPPFDTPAGVPQLSAQPAPAEVPYT